MGGTDRMRAAVAACLAVTAALLAGSGDARSPVAVQASPVGTPNEFTGAWTQIADSPLSGRYAAWSAWTGTEVLVFGGTDRDYPMFPAMPPETFRRDGAAYNPATDTWRRLAAAPFGQVHFPERGYKAFAVAGRTLYVMLEFREDDWARRLYAYDIDADTWSRLPDPPGRTHNDQPIFLAPAGEGVFAWDPSHERGSPADLYYDPATRRWVKVAPQPRHERLSWQFVVGTADGRVASLGFPRDPQQPEDGERSTYSADLYDPATNTWTRLPDSPVAGAAAGRWEVAGGRVVNLDPATDDHRPAGAQLEVATGKWLPLPPMPAGTQAKSLQWASGSGGDVALRQGWALHIPSGAWLRLPPLPGATEGLLEPATVVWAGDRFFAWGGFVPGRGEGEEWANRGWTWQPGTTVSANVTVDVGSPPP